MKRTYEHIRRYDMTRRFSVEQRKFGWTLRAHPKRFKKSWLIETCLDQRYDDVASHLGTMENAAYQEFQRAAQMLYQVAQLKREIAEQAEGAV